MSRLKWWRRAEIEAKSLTLLDLLYVGLVVPKAGLEASQSGQAQELASDPDVELGTTPQDDPVESRTLEEHKISIKSPEESSDLAIVVGAWDLLPASLRRRVLKAATTVL